MIECKEIFGNPHVLVVDNLHLVCILISFFNNRIVGGGTRPQWYLGSGPRCGTGSLGEYKTPGMRQSVWDGLWRPAGAFFQIGLGCVMSHHHIDGLCTFQFKFWRENSKWSSCQQSVAKIWFQLQKTISCWSDLSLFA